MGILSVDENPTNVLLLLKLEGGGESRKAGTRQEGGGREGGERRWLYGYQSLSFGWSLVTK